MEPPIPGNYEIVNALEDEDSFFSSIAQCLKQLRGSELGSKMLRQACQKYVTELSERRWLLETLTPIHIWGMNSIQEYLSNIDKGATTSNPEMDSRIICNVFNVNIHVVHRPDHDNPDWWHSIVNGSGHNRTANIDYESIDTIHVINEGDLHFKPILKKCTNELWEELNSLEINENQQSKIDTYEVRKGTSGAGGHFYEIKLLMLFYLRLQVCDEFYLAANMANVGAFDDAVFKYKVRETDGSTKTKTVFLQAKHSDKSEGGHISIDSLMDPKGAFSLRKYFESFQTIKRNFETKKGLLFKECFDDCRFIIFTNYVLDKKRKSDGSHICNDKRWLNCAEDEIVVGKNNFSRHLNPNEEINRDIRAHLICNPVCELAKVIYDYTLGTKKETGVKVSNILLKKYHIALANKVFAVNKQHPNESTFSMKFHESESLWKEFCKIAGKTQDDVQFRNDLANETINLYRQFGKCDNELQEDSHNNLVEKLADIIVRSKSYHIEISEPPNDINKLANNILVGVEEAGSKNIVKFCNIEPVYDARNFTNKLNARLKQKTAAMADLDVMNIRFQIKDFPNLSLPVPDEVVTDDEVKEFLNKLEFVLGQKNEEDLDEIIKAEMPKTCNVKDEDREAIFESVKAKVELYWKRKHENIYLKKDTKFVGDAKISISHFMLQPLQNFSKRGIQNTAVKFVDTILDKLKHTMLSHKVLNIAAENGTSLLSSVKVYQTLDREYDDKNYNFTQVHHLLNIQDHALRIFQSKKAPYFLVIESNRELLDSAPWIKEDNMRSFLDCLFKNGEDSSNKHVILITENSDFVCNVKHFRKEYDNINLNHLTIESQQRLLNKGLITLHGMTLTINQLIPRCNDQFKENITSKLLTNLITNTNIVIGNAPQRLSESEAAFTSFYDPMPKENLVKMIEKPEVDTMIVISGIKEPHVELLAKFLGNEDTIAKRVNERISDGTIIIAHENSTFDLKDFKQICASNYEKTVYWVAVNLELLRLQQVFYPHFYIKRYFRRYKCVLKLDILYQNNASEICIFCTSAGQVVKLVNKQEEKCITHFNTHCSNKTIIFTKDSQDASAAYEDLNEKNYSVHWLEIDKGNKFKWRKSNGPRPKEPIGNPAFDSDLFIGESNPHVFIFSDPQDQMKVMDMIRQRKCIFHNNCKIGRIIFSDDRDIMETIEPVKQTTHSLKVEGGDNAQLIWKETRGTILQLRAFIDEDKCERELYTEDKMSKLQDKVVIIVDEPGMGKTTSLTSVSQQMLNENWVIRINFLDCEHAIDSIKESELSMEDVYNFVSKVESTGLRNDWAKLMIKHKLVHDEHNTRPILFLFDGFDEINAKRQQTILPFLQFIKDQTPAKLWVTTRLHKKEILENGLSAFATVFQELSQKDRSEFLNSSWIIRLSPFLKQGNIHERTEKYSSSLLAKASNILGEKLAQILGVPLQLRLLAEGLRQDYVNYVNSGDDHLLNFSHVNVLYVYRHFIQEKYEIYLKDKNSINVNEPLKLPLFRSIDKNHETLAFNLLFPENDTIKPKRLSREEQDILISVGIIQSIGNEGKPFFLHRTFAEYFVAKLLFRYARKRERNPKKFEQAIKFLNTNIFEDGNHVIHNFINLMSIEPKKDFKTHIATLQNNINDIVLLMKETKNRTYCDKFERTPLHIAAMEGCLNVVKVLLDSGCDAIVQDVLGKTALHYAVMKGHKEVVAHILNYAADINIWDNIFNTPLHVDTEIGDSLFRDPKQLNSKLVTLTNTEDTEGKAALHYAIEIENWEIASWLIVNGANVSSQTNETLMKIFEYNRRQGHVFYCDDFISGLLMLKPLVPKDKVTNILLNFLRMGHTKVFHAVRRHLSDLQISEILDEFIKNPGNMDTICDEDHLKFSKYLMKERNDELMANRLAEDAARLGNLETLKYVLSQGHNKDYISYMKCAIEGHSLNIVEHLERSFSCDNDGNTALHLAARADSLKIVKYLVENNVDVKALNNEQQTPLDTAISYENSIVEPYLRIKSHSDSGNLQENSSQQNTLENASTSTNNPFTDSTFSTDQYAANAIPERISKDVLAENFLNLKFPEVKDKNGATEIHLAADIGDIDELESFDKLEEIFEITDRNGHTPLHYAVKNDRIEVVEFLLLHRVKFNPKCKKGKTPLDIATGKSAKLLQEIQNIFNIFQYGGSNVESLKSMQRENNDCFIGAINCRDNYSNELLTYAASANDIDSVLFILHNGGSSGFFPIGHCCKEVGHILNCHFEIDESFDVNYGSALRYIECFEKYSGIADVRDDFNRNILHKIANISVNYYLLNYFVERGANINAIDRFNKSVITSAIDSKNLDLVKFLLYKGVHITDLSVDAKQTLFDCANENDRPDITDLFETLEDNSEQGP